MKEFDNSAILPVSKDGAEIVVKQPDSASSASELVNIESDFISCVGISPRKNVTAARQTTFRIGGDFQFFIEPQSLSDLIKILKWAAANKQKINILGAGSNLLANSSGVEGWTLRLGKNFRLLERPSEKTFRVGAAYSLTTLARELGQQGLSGLEFAAGIPASLGGATRMNAGAHDGEMSSVIKAVEGLDSEGEFIRLESSELIFAYRKCSLAPDFFITAIELELVPSESSKVMQTLLKNLDYRKKTQPLSQPSAGSIFRNPGSSSEMSAGAIIERLGLKGRICGGAMISSLHANWIVNPTKTALSSDVLALIELCRSEARQKLNLELQPEVVMW